MNETTALLYDEPSPTEVAIYASFILLLNVLNYVLDRAVQCGLVGQIFLGTAWGTPGGQFLSQGAERTIVNLGYLGLILLIFEGGLSTTLSSFRGNFFLSLVVALTGIITPTGLSFLLVKLDNATILQAFAAGCALSSTSLGTVFTVLKSSGLASSRLGIVLTSAAMLDDIFGLVIIQIIASLGSSSGETVSASVILGPILVSLAFAILVPAACWTFKTVISRHEIPSKLKKKATSILPPNIIALIAYSCLLFSLAIGAAYAGTSILFAAYLVGTAVSYLNELPATMQSKSHKSSSLCQPDFKCVHKSRAKSNSKQANVQRSSSQQAGEGPSKVLPVLYRKTSQRRLSPEPQVLSTLEATTQEIATSGQPQQRQPTTPVAQDDHVPSNRTSLQADRTPERTWAGSRVYETYYSSVVDCILKPFFFASIGFSIPIRKMFEAEVVWCGLVYAILMVFGKLICGIWLIRFTKTNTSLKSSKAQQLAVYQARSLYPSAIFGSAMVSRGETGFLIAAVAQSNEIFQPSHGQTNLYLIVTWAIVVCTIIGPLAVGVLARRIKRLHKDSKDKGDCGSPLGFWADI